jgi:ribosome-associated protein
MSRKSHSTTVLEDDDWVSKSEKKRQAEDMQVIARALMKLSDNQRKKVPMSDALQDAIILAIKIKNTKEGFRRQMQLVAKILRNNNVDAIRTGIQEFDLRHKRSDVAAMKLELVRDAMLKKGDDSVNDFIVKHPDADRQKLRQLIRQANKEAKLEKPAKSSKELFQYIKQVIAQPSEG